MMEDATEVTLTEAAHSLGVSWAAAWKLVLTRDLSGRKAGNRWLVSKKSIEAYRARTDS